MSKRAEKVVLYLSLCQNARQRTGNVTNLLWEIRISRAREQTSSGRLGIFVLKTDRQGVGLWKAWVLLNIYLRDTASDMQGRKSSSWILQIQDVPRPRSRPALSLPQSTPRPCIFVLSVTLPCWCQNLAESVAPPHRPLDPLSRNGTAQAETRINHIASPRKTTPKDNIKSTPEIEKVCCILRSRHHPHCHHGGQRRHLGSWVGQFSPLSPTTASGLQTWSVMGR